MSHTEIIIRGGEDDDAVFQTRVVTTMDREDFVEHVEAVETRLQSRKRTYTTAAILRIALDEIGHHG